MLRQVVIQLDTSGHSYKGVPSNPSALPRNSTEQLQLQVAVPPDACQPLLNPRAGELQCSHIGCHRGYLTSSTVTSSTMSCASCRDACNLLEYLGQAVHLPPWLRVEHKISNAGSAVLVQRGSCPFGVKVQYLQQAKAAAMLVANTEDGMSS